MIKRIWILASLLAFFILLGLSLFFYFQPTFYQPTPGVEYQIRIAEGEVVGRSGGEVRWRLFLEEMEDMDGDVMHFKEGVYGEFYREDEVEYTITSNEVIYYTKKGDIEFLGSVVLTTEEGDRLLSEHLLWDDKEETLESPGPVRLLVGKSILRAARMKGYYQDDIFDFFDDVTLEVLLGSQRKEGEEEHE